MLAPLVYAAGRKIRECQAHADCSTKSVEQGTSMWCDDMFHCLQCTRWNEEDPTASVDGKRPAPCSLAASAATTSMLPPPPPPRPPPHPSDAYGNSAARHNKPMLLDDDFNKGQSPHKQHLLVHSPRPPPPPWWPLPWAHSLSPPSSSGVSTGTASAKHKHSKIDPSPPPAPWWPSPLRSEFSSDVVDNLPARHKQHSKSGPPPPPPPPPPPWWPLPRTHRPPPPPLPIINTFTMPQPVPLEGDEAAASDLPMEQQMLPHPQLSPSSPPTHETTLSPPFPLVSAMVSSSPLGVNGAPLSSMGVGLKMVRRSVRSPPAPSIPTRRPPPPPRRPKMHRPPPPPRRPKQQQQQQQQQQQHIGGRHHAQSSHSPPKRPYTPAEWTSQVQNFVRTVFPSSEFVPSERTLVVALIAILTTICLGAVLCVRGCQRCLCQQRALNHSRRLRASAHDHWDDECFYDDSDNSYDDAGDNNRKHRKQPSRQPLSRPYQQRSPRAVDAGEFNFSGAMIILDGGPDDDNPGADADDEGGEEVKAAPQVDERMF